MPSTATDRLSGLSTSVAVKAPCKAAAIANITLSGEQTVNGVACVAGDRVLVTAQTSSIDNGIWVCGVSAWARAKDFDGTRDVVDGTLVLVGTTAATSQFWLAYGNTTPIVPGTSAITFEQVDYQELALRADLASTADAAKGDALIGVKRTATDAAATTLHGWLESQIFNLKGEFGGVADDSTDNSTALLRALTAAAAAVASGGPVAVFLSPGIFRFSTDLTVKAGVSIIGPGKLRYTGLGTALSTEDVFPLNNNSRFEFGGLTTTTASPSVGPGLIGIKITNGIRIHIDCEVRGFSTAGVNLHSTTSKATLHVSFGPAAHIHENTRGVTATGVNVGANSIGFRGAQVRANIEWNIYSENDVRGWTINGGTFEAGGTGGTGGSIYLRQPYGLSISGAYFEQVTGLPAIDLANTQACYGVSIRGNVISSNAAGTGTAIKLGTSAFVNGVEVAGNIFIGWDIGVNPNAVKGGMIGPNSFSNVTTEYATPGMNCTGLQIFTTTGIERYGCYDSNAVWNGSAWAAVQAEMSAATYTVLDVDTHLVANRAGTVTVTLPSATDFPGRRLHIRTQQAQTVVSASSNVVPRSGGAAGTAILPATAGAWCTIITKGSEWHIDEGTP